MWEEGVADVPCGGIVFLLLNGGGCASCCDERHGVCGNGVCVRLSDLLGDWLIASPVALSERSHDDEDTFQGLGPGCFYELDVCVCSLWYVDVV
jgi:hypothetical protein